MGGFEWWLKQANGQCRGAVARRAADGSPLIWPPVKKKVSVRRCCGHSRTNSRTRSRTKISSNWLSSRSSNPNSGSLELFRLWLHLRIL